MIAWGQSASGEMLHISDVPRGKACACVCTDCNTPLIARQGSIAWHFAHASKTTCNGESALHKAAKQAVLRIVEAELSLYLPRLDGYFSIKDSAGDTYSEKWVIDPVNIVPSRGREEFRLPSGVQPDVLLEFNESASIAIEIHVRNRKTDSDVEKYKSLQQSALEIDLSKLPWDASLDHIIWAVREAAPRKWLFSSKALEEKDKAKHKLEAAIDRIREKKLRAVREAMALVIQSDANRFLCSRIHRSRLKATSSAKDAYGEAREITQAADLTLTAIDLPWKQYGDNWKTEGCVNDKVHVDVVLALDSTCDLPIDKATPTLVLEFLSGRPDLTWEYRFRPKWINARHWQEALQGRANKKLSVLLRQTEQKKAEMDRFALRFKNATDYQRLTNLCKALELPPCRVIGRHISAWNTTDKVWKSLVWYYLLREEHSGFICTEDIAVDPWLGDLLKWPNDPDSITTREMDLRDWFLALTQDGLAKGYDNQVFEVIRMPERFCPWR